MYNDSFRSRYTTIPFATYQGYHQPYSENRTTLSHCHREMELILITEGTAVFHTDGIDYPVTAGDLILVNPYEVHSTTFLSGCRCEHLCICFLLSLLQDSALCNALENGRAKATQYLSAQHPSAHSLAESLREAFSFNEEGGNGWELLAVGAVSRFFGLAKRNGLITDAIATGRAGEFSRRMVEFVDSHYSEPVTAVDAACAMYMSHGHFCRTFKAQFGHTFGEYLRLLRVERAAHLLRNTEQSISDIATAVGFSSFSYFSKVFREQMGISPSDYRRGRIVHEIT